MRGAHVDEGVLPRPTGEEADPAELSHLAQAVISEVVEDGVNGLLVDPSDPEGLAEAIEARRRYDDAEARLRDGRLTEYVARDNQTPKAIAAELHWHVFGSGRRLIGALFQSPTVNVR